MTASRAPHSHRTSCRACGGTALRSFLALGPQPLANAFLRNPGEFDVEESYPLDVYLCGECGLVQLLDVIDPEVLFGHYLYVTGVSETIAAHNRAYARTAAEALPLGENDLVVEIASNDGSLLACFQELGVRTLGVEPARNIAAMARARGIETINDFFGPAVARRTVEAHGQARAVVANNVLAHVDDTAGFLRACAQLIHNDGRIIVEVPYAVDMLQRLEYDTIYHEHLCYFAVSPLARLGEGAGLSIECVERMPVHGGSIRVWFRKGTSHDEGPKTLMARELADGVTSWDAWTRFADHAAGNREVIRSMLATIRSDGRTVAGYGAPAKGNTLLNFCGIGPELLPYTVDRNPLKVGTLTPGMHIPVMPVSRLRERRPDFLLILAWNFAEEIMAQQREFAEAGGRFIVPIPSPRIL